MSLEFIFTLESAPEPYKAIFFCKGREDGYYVSVTYDVPIFDDFKIIHLNVIKDLPESKRIYYAKRQDVIVSTCSAILRLKTSCPDSRGYKNDFSQRIGESIRLTITGLYSIDEYNLRCVEYALNSSRNSTTHSNLEYNNAYNLIESTTCVGKKHLTSAHAGGGGMSTAPGGGMSTAASRPVGGGGMSTAASRPVEGGGMSTAASRPVEGGGMSVAASLPPSTGGLSATTSAAIIAKLHSVFINPDARIAPGKLNTIQLRPQGSMIYLKFENGDMIISEFNHNPGLFAPMSADTRHKLMELKEELLTIVKNGRSSRRNRRRKIRKNRKTRRRH